MTEFVTYSECGFNIVSLDVDTLEEADEICSYDEKVLDFADEFDSVILERIRALLRDD